MASRHFPVRPNLDQPKHQAKYLLRAMHRSDPVAVADFREYHFKLISPASARLADARLVLASIYGLPSWSHLITACRLTNAISRDEVENGGSSTPSLATTTITHLCASQSLGLLSGWQLELASLICAR